MMGPMNNMPMNELQFAQQLIRNNPNIANNPRNQAMVNAIMNNDAEAGIKIANNLLQTYETNQSDGVNMAMQFFQNMMQGGPRR